MEKKSGISASIIADSKNEFGNRITSFVVTFPRIILAEINTHRMLSRNSASSRAIPFEKMLKMVEENPFIPIRWMKDHSGMQGNEYWDDAEVIKSLQYFWLSARDKAIQEANLLSDYKITKQIVNRLLEPFMWHTAIITATEWENFFALRAHDAAEIHLQDLAHKMLDAMNNSTPKQLEVGEWHIPFGDKIDWIHIQETLPQFNENRDETAIKIATARCARVSYMNFEGNDDYGADIKLHDRLLASGHMSPFEHCAKAMSKGQFDNSFHRGDNGTGPEFYSSGWSGNFRGFTQYRKTLNGENKSDNRLKK